MFIKKEVLLVYPILSPLRQYLFNPCLNIYCQCYLVGDQKTNTKIDKNNQER